MTHEDAIKNINALNAVCCEKDFYDAEFENALALAIDAIKKQATQEWISVKDRLPEKGEEVLVFDTRENWTGFAWLRPDETWTALGFDFPLDLGEVTHWMPMTQPPKGE